MKKKLICAFMAAAVLAAALCATGCSGDVLESISVRGQTAYFVGDDFAGATLTAVYANGRREQKEVTADMMKGFDTSLAGDRTVLVEYGGLTAELKLTVSDIYASALTLSDDTVTQYAKGAEFGKSDASAVLTYNNGTVRELDVTEDMLSGFDTGSVGNKTVTVSYGVLKVSYEISVAASLTEADMTDGGAYKLQVEDADYTDLSAVVTQSADKEKLEDTTSSSDGSTKPNGAEGYSTANISVNGNTISVSFFLEKAGTFTVGMRAQSGNGKGLKDAPLTDVLALKVNGRSAEISGTIKAASSTGVGWKDMTVWTELDDIAGELELAAGVNTLTYTYLQEDGELRMPNIDYFTVMPVSA